MKIDAGLSDTEFVELDRLDLMNPLIFQRPEFGAVFSLRSGNNRAKRTNWRPAALLTTMAFEHSHAAGLA